MFISCYVFDRHETPALSFAIFIQLAAFAMMQQQPAINSPNSLLRLTSDEVSYLQNIAQINALVFALSCLICALFVRNILSKNWQSLRYYEATQSQLLQRLFPAELVPPLLYSFENQLSEQHGNQGHYWRSKPKPTNCMQRCFPMGVIFLDIVDFTISKNNDHSSPLNWESIYSLFGQYDSAIEMYDAKRIKTNGDQYILLIGFGNRGEAIQKVALQVVNVCRTLLRISTMKVRISGTLGPVTSGVFDPKNPNFDIWGETVIRAARLERLARPNQILIDECVANQTKHMVNYDPPSIYNLKGLEQLEVYVLNDIP
jgi:hypothetical protein